MKRLLPIVAMVVASCAPEVRPATCPMIQTGHAASPTRLHTLSHDIDAVSRSAELALDSMVATEVSLRDVAATMNRGEVRCNFKQRPRCPRGMVHVPATDSCIDRFAWPNRKERAPMVAVSDVPETYLERVRAGETWDAAALCESVGKRVCTLIEHKEACRGTEIRSCNSGKEWRAPSWNLVARRDPDELLRLDQSVSGLVLLDCVSNVGARHMLGNVLEWVDMGDGTLGLAGGYWSRDMRCGDVITAHHNWHGYETSTRCCI